MLIKKMVLSAAFVMLLVAGAAQAGGDPARGEELAIDCIDCHGDDGKGDDETPAIAGLDPEYQFEQLMAFKTGERTDEEELMIMYTEDLTEQDMKDLAAYYASLPCE